MTGVVIFDKDGTLFDFQATWGVWTGNVIRTLAPDDDKLQAALAQTVDYDFETQKLRPGSLAIAGTPFEIATAVQAHFPDMSVDDVLSLLNKLASEAPQQQVAPLGPIMTALNGLGFKTAVMTNDSEGPAHHHLKQADAFDLFDMVVGSDSGFGAKPDPDPLLAICKHLGCDPAASFMVGDSTHDLHAGCAAGMRTIGVLTGPAVTETLSPHADTVLNDITDILEHIRTTL